MMSSSARDPAERPSEAPDPKPQTDDTPTVISWTSPRQSAGFPVQLGHDLTGRKLGPFDLMTAVGFGGMAAVIKAQDRDLGRTVALKILPPDMALDPENITRFRQEARAAAKLDHENIARVYHFGEDQGLHFIAFEFVEGRNLREMLEDNGAPLSIDACVSYMLQVAVGLRHADQRGVVHRDIKPSNIIVTPEGQAKIVDMGLARHLDAQVTNGGVTQSGVTLGTFDYISPEQALEPRDADIRSDIYSLGCTFYHLLTGYPPVPEGTAAKKLNFHQRIQPRDPRELNPALPDELTAILARMMAKKPEYRYQKPDQLIQHLLYLAETREVPTEKLSVSREEAPVPISALPREPRVSPLLIGAAIIVALVAFIFIGGFDGTADDSLSKPAFLDVDAELIGSGVAQTDLIPIRPGPNPSQQTEETVESAKIPDVAPMPLPRPREAANTEELLTHLREGAAYIQLTGESYDLSGKNAILQGDVLIEADPRNKPTLRLGYAPPASGVNSRPDGLTIRDGSVSIVGVRFEIASPRSIPSQDPDLLTAIDASGSGRLEFDGCEFLTEDTRTVSTAVLTLRQKRAATLRMCHFGFGAIGVRSIGSSSIEVEESTFAPHGSVFQIMSDSMNPTRVAVLKLRMLRCSVLMDGGAVIDVRSGTSCFVRAGHCLFSDPTPDNLSRKEAIPEIAGGPKVSPSSSVLIRLSDGTMGGPVEFHGLGEADLDVAPEMSLNNNMPLVNGYHQVESLRTGHRLFSLLEGNDEGFRIDDFGMVWLQQSPWVEQNPVESLRDGMSHLKAFELRKDEPRLHVDLPSPSARNRGNGLLGVRFFSNKNSYYDFPLRRPEMAVAPPPGFKIVNPTLTKGSSADGIYRELGAAIREADRGDIILIRANGAVEIRPDVLNEPDLDLTIRPDRGYNPTLRLVSGGNATPAMFKLFQGRLVLEGLSFELAGADPRMELSRSLVSLAGGGECVLRDCIITLRQTDGVSLSTIQLEDPTREMKMKPGEPMNWPTPRIEFINTWVRGRGDLISVSPSRPFELIFTNGLVTLDGSVMSIEPNRRTTPVGHVIDMKLSRVTTYLTGHLLGMRANRNRDGEMSDGLIPVRVEAERCLFVPAGELADSLIRIDEIDGEADLRQLDLLQWVRHSGDVGNVYAYNDIQALMRIQPGGADLLPVKPFGIDKWLEFTAEKGRPFAKVRFVKGAPAPSKLADTPINEWEIDSLDPDTAMAMTELPAISEVGAELDKLPSVPASVESVPESGK